MPTVKERYTCVLFLRLSSFLLVSFSFGGWGFLLLVTPKKSFLDKRLNDFISHEEEVVVPSGGVSPPYSEICLDSSNTNHPPHHVLFPFIYLQRKRESCHFPHLAKWRVCPTSNILSIS
jgi:hypothetical protein